MSPQKNHEHQCSYLRVTTERNRYFTGKYMAARDFCADQEYFLDRQRLQNQLTLGWGIACGLQVEKHHKDECKDSWVEIRPGLAIDCCGREIVRTRCFSFELKVPRDVGMPAQEGPELPCGCDQDQSTTEQEQRQAGNTDAPEKIPHLKPSKRKQFLLCICYCEEKIEPVPALYDDSTCCEETTEFNRTREEPRFCLVPLTKELHECWPIDDKESADEPYSPCHEQEHPADSSCHDKPDYDMSCEPYCPCGTYVPLALITARCMDEENRIVGYEIDLSKRKYILTPAECLTKIVCTNWQHGCYVKIDSLRPHSQHEEELRDYKGYPVLWLRFSRRLRREYARCEGDPNHPSFGHGINLHTVTVEHHDDRQPPTVLIPEKVILCGDDQTVVIVLPQDSPRYLDNDFVIVTVKCDFLEDCSGRPVDGDFLRGRLPTGNGVAGGTFQSWFRISPRASRQESY